MNDDYIHLQQLTPGLIGAAPLPAFIAGAGFAEGAAIVGGFQMAGSLLAYVTNKYIVQINSTLAKSQTIGKSVRISLWRLQVLKSS